MKFFGHQGLARDCHAEPAGGGFERDQRAVEAHAAIDVSHGQLVVLKPGAPIGAALVVLGGDIENARRRQHVAGARDGTDFGQIARARHGKDGVVHQVFGVQPGIDAAAEAERHVEGFLAQIGQCQVGRDVQLDLRVRRPEAVQAGASQRVTCEGMPVMRSWVPSRRLMLATA